MPPSDFTLGSMELVRAGKQSVRDAKITLRSCIIKENTDS